MQSEGVNFHACFFYLHVSNFKVPLPQPSRTVTRACLNKRTRFSSMICPEFSGQTYVTVYVSPHLQKCFHVRAALDSSFVPQPMATRWVELLGKVFPA